MISGSDDGANSMDGGAGNDKVYGGNGADTLHGGLGNDTLAGNANADEIYGDDGNDSIEGGLGDDILVGQNGLDTLLGGDGNDRLYSRTTDMVAGSDDGANFMDGGAGDDSLYGGNGSDTLLGGDGNDRLYARTDDMIVGSDDGANYFDGGAGNDYLSGGNGNDTLLGGDGADDIRGGASNDLLQGGNGDDYVDGGLGNDTINGGADSDELWGDAGTDSLLGEVGDDYLNGETGNDTLNGGAGADTIDGGDGVDTAIYGASRAASTITRNGDGSYAVSSAVDGADTLTNVEFLQFSDQTLDVSALFSAVTITSGATATTVENISSQSNVYNASATSATPGAIITYSISGGVDAALFSINGSTGAVTFKAAPNFEAPADAGLNNIYDITVRASDGSSFAEKSVSITVANANEAPSITSATTATIPENTLVSTMVYAAIATDPDANFVLTYSFAGGTDAALFNINASTGAVSFKTSPNFEAPADAGADNVYNIIVRASDGALFADKPVAITVTDVTEAPSGNQYTWSSLSNNQSVTFAPASDRLIFDDPSISAFSIGFDGAATSTTFSRDGKTITLKAALETLTSANVTFVDGSVLIIGDNTTGITNDDIANVIWGSPKDDTLMGLGGNDSIQGGPGKDYIDGGSGNDQISGGDGADELWGDAGNDTLDGGIGNDTLHGDLGDDSLMGADGDDELWDQTGGQDTLIGGAGNDHLSTLYGEGGDLLDGGVGDDTLLGGLGNDTLVGGDGADELWGDAGADSLHGGAGDDYLSGEDGNDTLLGADGADELWGDAGNDKLDGGSGNDTLHGDLGDDSLMGGDGDDELWDQTGGQDTLIGGVGNDYLSTLHSEGGDLLDGGAGDDTLSAGLGNNTLIGGDGLDQLFGDVGDDRLDGGSGNDTLYGGLGNDNLMGGDGDDKLSDEMGGQDTLNGGAGNDYLSTLNSEGGDVLDGGIGNDTLLGGLGNDTLVGGDGADELWGDSGADSLVGGSGDDSLNGEDGNDTLNGGDGADELWGDAGNDNLDGGNGNDSLHGGIGDDSLLGGDGDDELRDQTSGLDTLIGGAGNDHLSTLNSEGGDLLDGGVGNDTLLGGLGNDTLIGGDGADQLWGDAGTDSLIGGADADYLNGEAGNDTLNGGDGADELWGDAGNDNLDGGSGNDSLHGGLGDDSLMGGDGDDELWDQTGGQDTLSGGAGNDYLSTLNSEGGDVLEGGIGNDTLLSGLGNDTLIGGDGADRLWGDAGADSLLGGAGDDYLGGEAGNDTLNGGAGSDTLNGGDGVDIVIYSSTRAASTILHNADGSYSVSNAAEGSDILGDVEFIQFADKMVDLSSLSLALTFSSGGAGATPENISSQSTVYNAIATSTSPGASITYSISGGADAGLFNINASTGAVTFKASPNFEAPADAGADNVYEMTVRASDGSSFVDKAVAITVTDVVESVQPAWTKLLGSSGDDRAYAVTTGLDGAVYVGGYTSGNLDGQTSNGWNDAFLTRYNDDGSKAWTKLIGTISDDRAYALTTGLDGAIYISGYTTGGLDGQTNNGAYDAFLTKFNPDGTKVWTKILGTTADDRAQALTTGIDGSILVAGYTYGSLNGAANGGSSDAFLTKFNPDGSRVWTKLLGSSGSEFGQAIIAGGADGAIYVTGDSNGNIDGQINSGNTDIFLTKFYLDGTKAWTKLLGSSDRDNALAITKGADGAIYVSGQTRGNLDGQANSGGMDAFITKFNSDGVKVWTKLLGTSVDDYADALTTGKDGAIYMAGVSAGNINGQNNNYDAQFFVTKYNTDGSKSWTMQLGAEPGTDIATALTARVDGSIFVGGYTSGSIVGQANAGDNDIFLTSLSMNQSPPSITSSSSTSAPENISIAAAAYIITATDPDANTVLSYALAGGQDAALFNINASTGVVTFKTSPNFEAPADAGKDNVYDIVVQASDGSLTATKAVVISVTNVNEAPSVTSAATATTVENVSPSTAVYTVTAADPDANPSLTYVISGGNDASLFNINASTGAVTFKASPNFEAPTDAGVNNVYDIIVRASDGSLVADKAIQISVTDAIETKRDIDFNGDGKSDILLQNATDGTCYIWELNGTSQLVGNGYVGWTPGKDWGAKGTGDFNGDGKSDILLQNATDGTCYIWELNATSQLVGNGYVGWTPGKDWVAKGTGDFNGDGKSDILLQNATDGTCYIWELNGTSQLVGNGYVGWTPGKDWVAKGTGDFNGDGKSDILLQNATDGTCYIWELNGAGQLVGNGYVGWTPGKDWVAKGTGDFNGDGKSDILLQNATDGTCYIWELNGTSQLVGNGYVGWTPGTDWHAAA